MKKILLSLSLLLLVSQIQSSAGGAAVSSASLEALRNRVAAVFGYNGADISDMQLHNMYRTQRGILTTEQLRDYEEWCMLTSGNFFESNYIYYQDRDFEEDQDDEYDDDGDENLNFNTSNRYIIPQGEMRTERIVDLAEIFGPDVARRANEIVENTSRIQVNEDRNAALDFENEQVYRDWIALPRNRIITMFNLNPNLTDQQVRDEYWKRFIIIPPEHEDLREWIEEDAAERNLEVFARRRGLKR